jgi:NADPH:quinone reductase
MRNGRTNMQAMRAETFGGYEGMKLNDLPKPAVSDGKLGVRMTAAGVTPLEHTILSCQFPQVKVPFVLGGDGVGICSGGRRSGLPGWFACGVHLALRRYRKRNLQ